MSDLKVVPMLATERGMCMGCCETVRAVVSIEVDFYGEENQTYCAACAQRLIQTLQALLSQGAYDYQGHHPCRRCDGSL